MKQKERSASTKRTLLILVAILVLELLAWAAYKHFDDNRRRTAPKWTTCANYKAAADTYIQSKVGKDNYKKLYTYDPHFGNCKMVAYHFSPFKELLSPRSDGLDLNIITVEVDNNLHKVSSYDVPNCIKDSSLCNFRVNKQQVLKIARNSFLTADDITITWANAADPHLKKKRLPLAIIVRSCKQRKEIYIDYRNGAVIASVSGDEVCHPIEL
jgi:hypothetical protein